MRQYGGLDLLQGNHAPEVDMTRSDIDRAMRYLTKEVRESVVSYFSPVRAVIREMRKAVERASRQSDTPGESISDKPTTRR